jgi:hypothetical protein
MKNFRIVSLIIALVIMSSLFISCDGGADITLPPEEGNTTEAAEKNNAFVFVYNNTEVAPHAKMAEL